MTKTRPEVGFVGLGAMGFGMATHLVKEGYPVTAFDVSPQPLQKFKDAGGKAATSLAASAKGKSFYVCMVASAQQLEALLFEGSKPLIEALERDVTFLVASTVPAQYVQHLEGAFADRGRSDIFVVDCPVSGGAKRAAEGTLSIMAGGTKAAVEKAMPLLTTMSDTDKLFLPGGLGAGSNLKMVHQVLAAIQILATSEAMAFASWLKLDLEAVRQKVISSPAYSWMFENRSPRIVSGQFSPAPSALTIILKDNGIVTEAARLHGFPVPLSSAAEQAYLTGLLQGYGTEDDAGMVRIYCPDFVAPKSQPSEAPSQQDAEERTQLVVDLLEIVHLVAASEAICFAKRLELDLKQFVRLVNDAAGATRAFKEVGPSILETFGITDIDSGDGEIANTSLEDCVTRLNKVVHTARDLTCPLYLATAALGVLTATKQMAGPELGVPSTFTYYLGNMM